MTEPQPPCATKHAHRLIKRSKDIYAFAGRTAIMPDNNKDHEYTLGGDPNLLYRRELGFGSSGEVHEVLLLLANHFANETAL